MHALIIAETTPKLMKLASFARTTVRDHHWKSATTGAFTVAVDRFDFHNRQPRLKLKHKVQLNRIVALTADVDAVYIATDPTARGDLLAADLSDQLLARYPDRQIYRLRLQQLTAQDFSSAMQVSVPINSRYVDSMRVSRSLNFLVRTRVETLTGRPSGRAVLPLLARLAGLERPGQSRLRVRLASGVEFVSQFGPTESVAAVLEKLRSWGEVPRLQVTKAQQLLEPPELYRVWRLQQDGCRILGARAIEIASQTEQLYSSGYIGVDHQVDRAYRDEVRRELQGYGDAAAADCEVAAAIVPVQIRCLPSDVPKPVRPVYRLIWANTLCSFGRSMQVECEEATFVVDGLRFSARSCIPLSRGFDRTSFGLFYRRGRIGQTRAIEESRMFGGGPFESELLQNLALPYDNPAYVIKAATNLEYIGFDGVEALVLEPGRSVLQTVEHSLPQLLDRQMFAATETFLRSRHDPYELVEPWSWWAETVAKPVKKREVAYLR